jgi:hypothetical protein
LAFWCAESRGVAAWLGFRRPIPSRLGARASGARVLAVSTVHELADLDTGDRLHATLAARRHGDGDARHDRAAPRLDARGHRHVDASVQHRAQQRGDHVEPRAARAIRDRAAARSAELIASCAARDRAAA